MAKFNIKPEKANTIQNVGGDMRREEEVRSVEASLEGRDVPDERRRFGLGRRSYRRLLRAVRRHE
jgi:hypothetical protein